MGFIDGDCSVCSSNTKSLRVLAQLRAFCSLSPACFGCREGMSFAWTNTKDSARTYDNGSTREWELTLESRTILYGEARIFIFEEASE